MAAAKGTERVVGGERGAEVRWCGSRRPLQGPDFYSEWEVTREGVEQSVDEVGFQSVNSGYCVESRLEERETFKRPLKKSRRKGRAAWCNQWR